MTSTAHDIDHVAAHNYLAGLINAELARFGMAADLNPSHHEGDPLHINEHSLLVTKLEALATTAGQTYTFGLPAKPTLGSVGHINDHDQLLAAVSEVKTWPAWNSATGGTVTDVANYNGTGETWRVHTFTSNDTCTISIAVHPFRILLVGGGGGVGVWGSSWDRSGGGGGGVVDTTQAIASGAHSITVGAGGALWDVEYGGNSGGKDTSGGETTAFGLTAGGGQHGQASPHGIGAGKSGSPQNHPPGGGHTSGGSWANNGGGAGSNGAAGGNGIVSTITGASVTYGQGGAGGSSPHGGRASAPAVAGSGNGGNGPSLYQSPVNNPGNSGCVVVAYRIG